MKTKLIFSVLLIPLILLFLAQHALAQVPEPVIVRIETRDGSIFQGELISETDMELVVRTVSSGDIVIQKANIKRIKTLSAQAFRNGEYWHENPQSTRYFFVPNAMGLPKGQGYYQNVLLFFNNVNYGLTNNFSLGVGIVPVFLFGESETPVWILPKFSIPIKRESVHVAVGAMIGGVIGEASFGILYGMLTYGNRDKNISLGLGYGYADGELANAPLVTLSGMYRLSKRWYAVTDNYFVPTKTSNGLLNFGVRWAPERVAIDFSLLRLLEDNTDGDFIGIPMVGVSIPF